ncbi:hypothetical protein EV426DRAFT_712639 [Tirmania nivea]|nr:hypothetical protein EV426DRAFT_712639 [Tirmania nivea]
MELVDLEDIEEEKKANGLTDTKIIKRRVIDHGQGRGGTHSEDKVFFWNNLKETHWNPGWIQGLHLTDSKKEEGEEEEWDAVEAYFAYLYRPLAGR